MKNIIEISDVLRGQARQIGVTSKVLAEQTGTSTQTLWKVMKGSHDFKVSTLLALADRLDLELVLLQKAAAPGLASDVTGAPAVKTRVQATLERMSGNVTGRVTRRVTDNSQS